MWDLGIEIGIRNEELGFGINKAKWKLVDWLDFFLFKFKIFFHIFHFPYFGN